VVGATTFSIAAKIFLFERQLLRRGFKNPVGAAHRRIKRVVRSNSRQESRIVTKQLDDRQQALWQRVAHVG
jgi:hypothetical protein